MSVYRMTAIILPHRTMQYVFCNEVLADYVDEIANYANFNDMN